MDGVEDNKDLQYDTVSVKSFKERNTKVTLKLPVIMYHNIHSIVLWDKPPAYLTPQKRMKINKNGKLAQVWK